MRVPRLGFKIVTVALWLVVPAAIHSAGSQPFADGVPRKAETILAAAFANRYEVDLTSQVQLVMRNDHGQERRRKFQAAYKVIDGRMHSIGRLVWPHYLRGMAILTIEADDRGHDAFIYLPSLGKVRRISTSQRGDSFFGSDVTYEDLERRRIDEYDIERMEPGSSGGEPVYIIAGRSRREFSYARIVFVVSQADGAILETQHFKRGQETPFRVISAPRGGMVSKDGHVLPTRLTVSNRLRGTSTEVTFEDLQINPAIDDHLFSVSTLERDRDLPIDRP
jgi:hypothetical protein